MEKIVLVIMQTNFILGSRSATLLSRWLRILFEMEVLAVFLCFELSFMTIHSGMISDLSPWKILAIKEGKVLLEKF